ncbi:MAG: hypothetical protein MJY70_06550 [Bacteroidales bacterium]|nr:hypothetical protein [Bacteroidales bacterium]
METILEDLWYGRINPKETIYRDNPEYQKAQKELNKRAEQLEARLNQEEKPLLEEIEDAFYKTQEDIEKIAYMAGFRLGMRLALAALTETSD